MLSRTLYPWLLPAQCGRGCHAQNLSRAPRTKIGGMWSGYRTGQAGALCPTGQPHISAATVTETGLGRGWLEAPGWTRGGSGTGSTLPGSSGQQQWAFHRVDTHSLPLPHSQQRQEEASAQRKTAQEAGPPPLPAPSLPPRSGGGSGADAILKPPGLCP